MANKSKRTQNFLMLFDQEDDRVEWFAKLKNVASEQGFTARPEDFKRGPVVFKGTVAHAAQNFRVLLTGSSTSPGLFSIMQVMGPERLRKRLSLGQ